MSVFSFNYSINDVEIQLPEKNRTIVCFGAGTAGEMLPDILPAGYQIAYYTDNNDGLWGTFLNGIKIIDPQELKLIKDIYVIIVSQHVISIKNQLESYGFQEGKDYYDLYSKNEAYMRFGRVKQFEQFLNRIDRAMFETQKKIPSPKIGIVILSDMIVHIICYQIAIYLVLKSKGYDVELILDFVGDFVDVKYRKGDNDKLKTLISSIMEQFEENFGEQSYVWIQERSDVELNEADQKIIDENTRDTLISYMAYMQRFLKTEEEVDKEELRSCIKEHIIMHYKAASKFLSEKSYDVLMEFNGTREKRQNYMHLGHKFGMRIANFDNRLWATDYPCCWHYDLCKVYDGFSEEEKAVYAKKGGELFAERMYNNSGQKGYIQLVEYNRGRSDYAADILIPLNVMFDSAVLGLDKVFESPEQWFVETVRFLFNKTKARVIIKESPAGPSTTSLSFSTYLDLVKEYIDNDRFVYLNRDSQVNVYNLLEGSKIILPYSSTIGIEAAIMGKTVITHTNCFYAGKGFDLPCGSKEVYFDRILDYLERGKEFEADIDVAKAYFGLLRTGACENMSEFYANTNEWNKWTFSELVCLPEMHQIERLIADGIPWFNSIEME